MKIVTMGVLLGERGDEETFFSQKSKQELARLFPRTCVQKMFGQQSER